MDERRAEITVVPGARIAIEGYPQVDEGVP